MDTSIREGARVFRAWLVSQGSNIPKFCDKHGLDRINVMRIMKGERQRITVDFAKTIEVATGGAVPMELWARDAEPDRSSGTLPADPEATGQVPALSGFGRRRK